MGTAPASIGSLRVADGCLMALYAGATMLASILYSSALVEGSDVLFWLRGWQAVILTLRSVQGQHSSQLWKRRGRRVRREDHAAIISLVAVLSVFLRALRGSQKVFLLSPSIDTSEAHRHFAPQR